MSGDIEVLNDILPFLSYVPGSTSALYSLYKAIGPEMPHDLRPTPAKSHLPTAAPVKYFNYDEGHAGRFSVPDTDGASVPLEWVMQQSNPADFVMRNLAYYDNSDESIVRNHHDKTDASGEGPTGDEDNQDQEDSLNDAVSNAEFTVFIPGLNTLHQPVEGETTTIQRLKHYVNILGPFPMAQLHIGTSFDQGSVRISHGGGRIIRLLFNNTFIPESLKPTYDGDHMVWDARQIDRLQTALSKANVIDTPIKLSMRALFATCEIPDASPVVIVVYSRASIEAEAALKKYIQNRIDSGESEADVQQSLRDRVTVLTVGNAAKEYPDGPAYIHLASWNDPLTKSSGTSENDAKGGGRDAVFLHCASPFNEHAFDNHNFGALTGQFLALVLAASNAKGIRDLWEKGQKGEIVIPDDIDNLTRAMIQITSGYDWLWNSDLAWKDVPYGALPEKEDAVNILRQKMGDKFVDRVLANFNS